jgi:hypothetical protein
MLALLLASLAFAETLTASQPVACTRWPGEKGISLALQAGDEVEVIAREGAFVRVRKGTEYGWADSGALQTTAAAGSARPDTASAPPEPTDAAGDEPRKKGSARKRGKGRTKTGG